METTQTNPKTLGAALIEINKAAKDKDFHSLELFADGDGVFHLNITSGKSEQAAKPKNSKKVKS